jgi:16S rRNA (guanine527-N7)-methyltransferase
VKQLVEGARRLDVPLSEDQLNAFQTYYETLINWNRRVNLTRITDYEEVQIKHFLDSLSCLAALKRAENSSAGGKIPGYKAIDVGSGAGFPGLALKIAMPELRVTLLDGTGKKTEFLRFLIERLELPDVTVVKARAEEAGQDHRQREQYDVALARALAGMSALAELTLPLVRVGGLVVAQKGGDPAAEVDTAHTAIVTLGGQVQEITPVVVPGLEGTRHLVVLKKVSRSPSKYPRRPGMPVKRPIV